MLWGMRRASAVAVFVIGGMVVAPRVARADLGKLWVEGRGDLYAGTSDLFERFDNRFGVGVEAGLQVLAIQIFAEGLMMGTDQYLLTGNLGFGGSFGEKARFSIGAFTGPLLMLFPESAAPSGVDFSGLPADQQTALLAAGGYASLDQAEAEFDGYAAQEKDLGRTAFGWNLVRARAALDVRLAPSVYLGIAGLVGYHLLISGEDAAAGAKNEAVTKYATDNGIPANSPLVAQLREVVGARPVDKSALDGFNYDGHVYLRLEF